MRSALLRAAVLLAGLVALGAAAFVVDLPDLATIPARAAALGPAAPVAFTAVYALVVPTPVPKSLLSTAAGLVFGLATGIAVVIVGAVTGAVLAFGLARWLGRDAVARLVRDHRHLDRIDAMIERRGMLAALTVRFVPVLPFTVLNYACGVTAMRLRHYVVGTAVGIAPGSCALVALGHAGSRPSPWFSLCLSAGFAALCLVTTIGWRFRRRSASDVSR